MSVKNLKLNEIYFDGGINNTDPIGQVEDNELVAGENKELVGVELRDRGGYSEANSTAVGSVVCQGMFDIAMAGTHYLVSMWSDGKVYTGTSSLTEIGSGFDTGTTVRWSAAILQDSSGDPYAVLTNNVDEPQKWNPAKDANALTNLSASGSRPTSGKVTVTFGDRIWVFKGDVGHYTDLLDCTTFSSNSHNFPDGGNSEIIGAFVYKSSIYASSKDAVHRVDYTGDATTPFTYEGEYIVKGHGYYHWSVAEINGYIYALGTDGRFYIFDGVNEVPIDGKIRGYSDTIVAANKQYAWACYDPAKHQYMCAIDMDTSGSNDTILTANVEKGVTSPRWNTKWTGTGMSVNSLVSFDSSGSKVVYGGSSGAVGKIYQINTGSNDNNGAIDAWFETKQYAWGTEFLEKHFRMFNLVFTSVLGTFGMGIQFKDSGNVYTVDLEAEGDYLASEEEQTNDFWLGDDTNLGSFLVGETEIPDVFTNLQSERAYAMQLKFTSQGYNSTAKLKKFLVAWQPTKVR